MQTDLMEFIALDVVIILFFATLAYFNRKRPSED